MSPSDSTSTDKPVKRAVEREGVVQVPSYWKGEVNMHRRNSMVVVFFAGLGICWLVISRPARSGGTEGVRAVAYEELNEELNIDTHSCRENIQKIWFAGARYRHEMHRTDAPTFVWLCDGSKEYLVRPARGDVFLKGKLEKDLSDSEKMITSLLPELKTIGSERIDGYETEVSEFVGDNPLLGDGKPSGNWMRFWKTTIRGRRVSLRHFSWTGNRVSISRVTRIQEGVVVPESMFTPPPGFKVNQDAKSYNEVLREMIPPAYR